jgi:hypothetical protein
VMLDGLLKAINLLLRPCGADAHEINVVRLWPWRANWTGADREKPFESSKLIRSDATSYPRAISC